MSKIHGFLGALAILLSSLCLVSCFSSNAEDIQSGGQIDSVMLAHVPAIMPMSPEHYKVSSPFGERKDPFSDSRTFHKGIDFSMPMGTPVYATGDGVVVSIDRKRMKTGYGRILVIDHGYGYKTKYAHCSMILVSPGQEVLRSQMVAKSGNSGNRTTAPHLHYEVLYNGQPVNPADYIDHNISKVEYASMVEKVKSSIKEEKKAARKSSKKEKSL